MRSLSPWIVLLLSACAHRGPEGAATPPVVNLPASLAGRVEVLAAGDPDAAEAELARAEQPAGKGGIVAGEGMVIRVLEPLPVWRMWDRAGARRMGRWWAADAPSGSRDAYRRTYEICRAWNQLTTMAKCTLKAGAVVAVGPGNAMTCEGPAVESYAANHDQWQLYVAEPESALDCPDEGEDYVADCRDVAKVDAGAVCQ